MLQLACSRVVSIMPKPQPGGIGCVTFIWSLNLDLSSVADPAQGTKALAGIAPGSLNWHKQPHQ